MPEDEPKFRIDVSRFLLFFRRRSKKEPMELSMFRVKLTVGCL